MTSTHPSSSSSCWKVMGSIRLLFPSKEDSNNALECDLLTTSNSTSNTGHARLPASTTLISKGKMVSLRNHQVDYNNNKHTFLLQSSPKENCGMSMSSVNGLLLHLNRGILVTCCDADDDDDDDSSSIMQSFVYRPRSLHTAELYEYLPHQYQQPSTKPKTVLSTRKQSVLLRAARCHQPVLPTTMTNEAEMTVEMSSSLPQQDPAAEEHNMTTPVKELATLDELKSAYDMCLLRDESDETLKPRAFVQQLVLSIDKGLVVDTTDCLDLLATYTELQSMAQQPLRNQLYLEIGIRLALVFSATTSTDFTRLHYNWMRRRAATRKMRKLLKSKSPTDVFQEELFNFFSLLAIRYDSPEAFADTVKELVSTTHTPQDTSQLIYDFFELNFDDQDDNDTNHNDLEEPTRPAVLTPTPKKELVRKEDKPAKKEQLQGTKDNHSLMIEKSRGLTALKSNRKNSLLQQSRRASYVGSHFNTKLSNVSTLFRQVKVPCPTPSNKKRKEPQSLTLASQPKRSRTISFQFNNNKTNRLVSETPAKRTKGALVQETPASNKPPNALFPGNGLELSPMAPSGLTDSQNARWIAQQALAAARRKIR